MEQAVARLLPSEMSQHPIQYLNFQPVFYFPIGSTGSFKLELEDVDLSEATIFSIYNSMQTDQEQLVWSLQTTQTSPEIFSTQRIVDLEEGKLINFQLSHPHHPHITHYLRHKAGLLNRTHDFRLGKNDEQLNLPAQPFTGIIGETLIFDRILEKEERQIISSYLALKYGISLAGFQRIDYLNSRGNSIWITNREDPFAFRICGLGRDDDTGLFQKQSTSGFAPDLLTIGLGAIYASNEENPSQVDDLSFLLWADNDDELAFGAEAGKGRMTKRRWRAQLTNAQSFGPLEIQVNDRRWITPLQEKEYLWMCIDQSGSGLFPPEASVFFRSQKTEGDHTAIFRDVFFESIAGQAIFTFSAGPEMLPLYWTDSLLCQGQAGRLVVGVAGGKAPFHYRLSDLSGNLLEEWSGTEYELASFSGLSTDQFLLKITDAAGFTGVTSINACPKDEVRDVSAYAVPPFVRYNISPNPTRDGHFLLSVRLQEEMNMEVVLLNEVGKKLATYSFRGDEYYEYHGLLPAAGMYFLQLTAGKDQLSLPIIRQ